MSWSNAGSCRGMPMVFTAWGRSAVAWRKGMGRRACRRNAGSNLHARAWGSMEHAMNISSAIGFPFRGPHAWGNLLGHAGVLLDSGGRADCGDGVHGGRGTGVRGEHPCRRAPV